LSVAAHDAKVGDHLPLARRCHSGASLFDDTHNLITWSERKRPLEIRVAAPPDKAIRESSAGGEHFNADLARSGVRDSYLFD
jgi:hypothetical protein